MTSWHEPTAPRPRKRAGRIERLLLAHVLRERYPTADQVLAEVYARPKPAKRQAVKQ